VAGGDAEAIFGRSAERAGLAAAVAAAADGAGRVVLLAGEPGVGKSRLAADAVAAARAAGVRHSWGACREAGVVPPLWPWRQILRRLDGDLARIDVGESPDDRFRLYDSIQSQIRDAARPAGLVIVLDDLHRADTASLHLLRYLADTWTHTSVVITYRDTEVEPSSLVSAVLAELARTSGCRRYELAGLEVDSIAEWLAAAGHPAADAAWLSERTDGNPLFLSECIQLLDSGDVRRPLRTVGEVIRERLAPLPEATREALEVAALLGREFEYPPLAAALHSSPADTVTALDPAVRARLIVADPARGGAYRFTHALVRDAVEEQLVPSLRAGLHARIFAALGDLAWPHESDLAQHAQAGRPLLDDSAVSAAVRAAAVGAERLFAWDAAAQWWQAAVGIGTADPAVRLRLGRALLCGGAVDEARAHFEALADGADDRMVADAALAMGETVAEVAPDPRLVRMLDRALDGDGISAAQRVRLQARRAIATYWLPDGQAESRSRSAAAVALAEGDADLAGRAEALIARQFTLRGPDLLDERIAAGEAVVRLGQQLDDSGVTFRGYQWLLPDHFQSGRMADVHADLDAITVLAEEQRNPLRRWWVLVYGGLLANARGDYARAEELANEQAALGARLNQPAAQAYRLGQLGRCYWSTGRLPELDADLEAGVVRFPGLVTVRCMLALSHAQSDARRARAEVAALCRDNLAELRRDSLFLASVAILGQAAVACAARDAVEQVLAALRPYVERNLIQGVPSGWGSGAWHLAALAAHLGHTEQAATFAASADELHDRWGIAAPIAEPDRADTLSARERQVLARVAVGRANGEIAAELGISVHTVERHIANIFIKLDVRNRAEATAWAHRRGMVPRH
jgi:DNA-binding CsgD family transcriptional regulator